MNRTNRAMPRPSTILAVIVAGIATSNAYLAMVEFAIDTIGMNPGTAYVTAGVYELSLFTVAVLAREAAKDNRPNGVLLTLTWMLSGASGMFAAWHEHTLGHDIGAILFRLSVPVLAALMWHLALIGERHLASGTTWQDSRRDRRMQALYEATEDRFRLHGTHRAAASQRAYRRALHRARRVSPPHIMIQKTREWDAASAAETMTIVTARENHARQVAAFANRQVEATTPVPVPSVDLPTPTAPATTATKATKPVVAEPVPALAGVAAAAQTVESVTANVLEPNAGQCVVCGKPTKAGTYYCTGTNEDGTRNQKCKNRYYSAAFKDVRARVGLAKAVDKVSQRTTGMSATVGDTQRIAFA